MANFWLSNKAIAVYGVSLLALAEIIDLTIVSVALPQIMGSLGADLGSIAMVTTSYVVAAAVFIPLSGLMIQKYGSKRVVLISTALFTISSMLCGIASSLPEMIIFRLFQGMGGAFLPAVAQAYIAKSFANQEQQKMMTLFGIIVVLGPILGPVLGGSLSENLSWRWIFYVNLPVCMIGFILILLFMEKDKLAEKVKVDYISFFFMAIGIGCLEFFIDEGNQKNWFNSIEMIIFLAISLLSLGFFIWRGLLGSAVVNFSVFKNKNFMMSCFTMFFFMMFVTATLGYFPSLLQQIYKYPVDIAGYITAPRGVAAVFSAPIVSFMVNRIGARKVMFLGIFGFSCSCMLLSKFGVVVSAQNILLIMMLQGSSMMFFFIPIMQICFIGFSDEQSTEVSGIFNFFRNFACSVGTSLAATIISEQQQVNYHNMGQHLSPYERGFNWWAQNFPHTSEQVFMAVTQQKMQNQGLLLSYLDSYYLFGILLFCILWIPFFLKQPNLNTTEDILH